jgi:hypothetical protein
MTSDSSLKPDNASPEANEIVTSAAVVPEPGNGRREALLKLGRLAGYVAPLTVALMSDKAMANYF